MKNYVDNQGEKKISILYLLYTIDMPMSNAQLEEFASETDIMDYWALRSCLGDMTETKLIEESCTEHQTYYTITEEGEEILRSFKNEMLSVDISGRIHRYISRHKKKIKEELSVSADWFYDADSDFIVKCGLYEGQAILMEVNVSVVDRDMAQYICRKWKENSSEIFRKFLNELSGDFSARKQA